MDIETEYQPTRARYAGNPELVMGNNKGWQTGLNDALKERS